MTLEPAEDIKAILNSQKKIQFTKFWIINKNKVSYQIEILKNKNARYLMLYIKINQDPGFLPIII